MTTYKSHLRIPTSEPYAYIEMEYEGSPEDTISAYRQFTDLLKPQEGLPDKEYNKWLDGYLNGGTGDLEQYNAMSDQQKFVIQTIKRSLKRLKAHETE